MISLALFYISCNDSFDNTASDTLSPALSSNTDIKSYRKLDLNIPGDPHTTPENFVEISPVIWDGVSEFEPGVT